MIWVWGLGAEGLILAQALDLGTSIVPVVLNFASTNLTPPCMIRAGAGGAIGGPPNQSLEHDVPEVVVALHL